MELISLEIFVDFILFICFIKNIEKIKNITEYFSPRREIFLELMYLFVKFIWYLLLTMLYLYIPINYILNDENEKINIFVAKLSLLTYIVEHIMMK